MLLTISVGKLINYGLQKCYFIRVETPGNARWYMNYQCFIYALCLPLIWL
jgi:hypothetical protein